MGIQSTHTVTCASHHHAYCVHSFWTKLSCDPRHSQFRNWIVCMHDCILHRNTHKLIGPQVPHTLNSDLSVPPSSIPPMLDYTSINLYIYIQCQSNLHYYVHLTPGKLLPSGVFLRLDQKGLGIRNRTRRMILPIPTNVSPSNTSFEVLLTESPRPTNYTSYTLNYIHVTRSLAPLGHSFTKTAFLSPPWRNTLILITASILIYPYLPSPSKQSLSPSLSPEAHASTSNSETPLVTRLLAKYTPDAKTTYERNDKHLELSAEKAGERLLFQEAERPRVHRMRFPR
jgi:hypothetical protein